MIDIERRSFEKVASGFGADYSSNPASNPAALAVEHLGKYIEDARQNPESRVLYENQVSIMEDLRDFLAANPDNPRGYISLPTGVGKTVLFTEFIKATGLRTLVLTPTQLLLKQTEAAFGKFGGDEELTIGKVFASQKDEARVTITTYASFVRHTKDKDSPFLDPKDYDVVILDEAHRALGAETQAVLDNYPVGMMIGLTATEDYSDKKTLDILLPHEIHKMTIKEAVESSLVSPFSVWVVQTETDMSEVRLTTTNEYDQGDLQRTLNTQVRNQVAVELYKKHFYGQKAVFSCSGVEHAKDMANLLSSSGVPAEAIHGGLSIAKQQQIKSSFADMSTVSGLFVLCNDKILAEGFDEPGVVAAFNLSPTLSRVRCQQRSGRALRIDPKNPKKEAVIIEFVDKNYIKPPVLFSDSNIAGAASLGVNPAEDTDDHVLYDFNLASALVVTSPETVESMSREFNEIRSNNAMLPPEGWLTMSGMIAQMNTVGTLVQKAVKEMKMHIPDFIEGNCGRFKSPGVSGGKTSYYSPAVVEALKEFIVEPDVRPEGWLGSAHVAARYDFSQPYISIQLRRTSRRDPKDFGEFVESRGSARKMQFFSPDCVRKTVQAEGREYFAVDEVPADWVSLDVLEESYGKNATTFALEELRNRNESFFRYSSQTANDTQYFSKGVCKKLKEYVTPPRSWLSAQQIAAELDIDIATLNEVISLGKSEKRIRPNYNYRLCSLEGIEIECFAPYTIGLIDRLHQAKIFKSEPPEIVGTEFREDEVVLIPRFEPTVVEELPRQEVDAVVFSPIDAVASVADRLNPESRILKQKDKDRVPEKSTKSGDGQKLPNPYPPRTKEQKLSYVGAMCRFDNRK